MGAQDAATRSGVVFEPHPLRDPRVSLRLVAPFDTQLRSAEFSAGMVRRVGRLGMLADRDARVVVVSAPAGYGKTTLLAEWAEVDDRPYAWVSVTERENAVLSLVGYIVRALEAIEPINAHDMSALARIDADINTTLLPSLGVVLERRAQPFVLALDDVHLLKSDDTKRALSALVAHMPVASQLVLSGRDRSPIGLGRLRAASRVSELGAEALALQDDEARTLLSATELDIGDKDIDTIIQRAEGWPAGLYLATLSLQSRRNPVDTVCKFSGTDRFVGEYLRDELLRSLPEETVQFMLQTSVLERLSGAVCDALVGRTDSGAVLEALAASNMMVTPLDAHAEWYRYHHLLRDLLVDELRRRAPRLEAELHLKASFWYEGAGDEDAAIRHACVSGNLERARDLLWGALPVFIATGRSSFVGQWLAFFDEAALFADPTLGLAVAASKLAAGDPGEVAWWTAVAEAAGGSEHLPDGESRAAFVSLLHAFVADSGLADMRENVGRACRLFRPTSQWRFLAGVFEAGGLLLQGDKAAAFFEFDELVRSSAVRMPPAEAGGQALFALAAIDEGAWGPAAPRVERARQLVRDLGLEDKPSQALTFAVSAFAYLHVGATGAARREWNRARMLLTHMAGIQPWVAVLTRCTLARVSIAQGDVAAAHTIVAEAEGILDTTPGWEALRPRVAQVQTAMANCGMPLTASASPLTTAELRVLRYLPTHLLLEDIAAELYVSRNTVKTHALSIYRKLGVSSRGSAVKRARDSGLLETESVWSSEPAI
jgi:LuxR family maltose regulon positive regulatory protein